MSGKYRKDHQCLNCGFHVEEHYCSRCGQPNLELKENFWQFIGHSVAHYFHFDNKFFQTLVPLLTKPGKVTLDYLAGRRARYINPISLYIFVSIVYFLVISTGHKKETVSEESAVIDAKAKQLKEILTNPNAKPLKGLSIGKRVKFDEETNLTEEIHDRLAFGKLNFELQERALQMLKAEYQLNKSDSLKKIIGKLETTHDKKADSTYQTYLARQQTLPEAERDDFFDRMMKKRNIEIGKNSELINKQLEQNRSKQYFLLMPLMAFFVMINFRKNHIYYLDHLIFTIHGMTALFMVLTVTFPLIKFVFGQQTVMGTIIDCMVIAWVLWYMFKSLKIFYQRSTKATVWRMVWICMLYGLSYKITQTILINIIYYVAT